MEKLVSFRGTEEISELPFGLVHLRPEALNWLRGARGERFMAAELEKLGRGWRVLHSIPWGNGEWDIDHLVIGPPGVFPINTKRLIDAEVVVSGSSFRKSGWKVDYLEKAAKEANRVIQRLNRVGISSPVLPIIAISGASSVRVKSTPVGLGVVVGVAPVKGVVRKLRKRNPVLSPEAVDAAYEVLTDPSVWTSKEPSQQDADLIANFQRIDRGVGRLRNVVLVAFGAMVIALAWWASSAYVAFVFATVG
jgi:hypothetical protein